MTCNQCGQPADGALCRPCERAQRASDEYESVTDGGAAATQQAPQRQLQYIPVGQLRRHDDARDIREQTVDEIEERIDADEFNPAKPLRVFEESDGYVVADGNHRLAALRELEYSGSVPCVVEPVTDPDYAEIVEVAAKSNRDEDTFAEDDLFDHLDRIERLSDGHTQAEIAETLGDGWARSKVSNYTTLLGNVATAVLETARNHQKGRVASDATSVADFSEYWFRTSRLYDLNRDGVDEYAKPDEDEPKHAQMRVMEWYINDQNGDATKSAVQRKVEDVQEICEQLDRLKNELDPGVDDETQNELWGDVTARTYTDSTLDSAIENANEGAKNRAEYGTGALDGLRSLEDNSVDCVVTDPPYGVDYTSQRDTDRPQFPDGEEDTAALLDDVFDEIGRVCKANAHVYIFFSISKYELIKSIAERHFELSPGPLVWIKNNHVPTRDRERGFEKMYAMQYEAILMCRMPNGHDRRLNNGVSSNVFNYARPSGDERYHDTQKPRDLLAELITNSTGKRERVLDPFAGSGSTLLAAAENGRHYVGFEQDGSYEDRFVRELREVAGDE